MIGSSRLVLETSEPGERVERPVSAPAELVREQRADSDSG
jgi:hypothetical protein